MENWYDKSFINTSIDWEAVLNNQRINQIENFKELDTITINNLNRLIDIRSHYAALRNIRGITINEEKILIDMINNVDTQIKILLYLN